MGLSRQITASITDLLKEHPQGLSITDIVKKIDISRNTAGRYLENLLVSGQVEMRHFGMAKIYALSHRIPESAMLSITSDLVMQLDANLRIIFANEPFLKILGVPSAELFGKNIEYTAAVTVFGDALENFIKDIIQKQAGNANATFEDIEKMKAEKGFLDMTFVGTNISTGQVVFFNNYFTPKMKLCDAIRVSMSIPFFFEAIRSPEGVLIDGGMIANYPIKLFDKPRFLSDQKNLMIPDYYAKSNKLELEMNPKTDGFCLNPETLGFRLDSKREIKTLRDSKTPPKIKIDSFKDFTKALIKTLIDAQQDNAHLESDDWKRTVYIDTLGIGTTDFDISDHKKDKLIQSGYDCAKKYFAWKNGLKLVA